MDDQDGVAGNIFDTHCYMKDKFDYNCRHWDEPPYVPSYHSPVLENHAYKNSQSYDCIADYLAEDDDYI